MFPTAIQGTYYFSFSKEMYSSLLPWWNLHGNDKIANLYYIHLYVWVRTIRTQDVSDCIAAAICVSIDCAHKPFITESSTMMNGTQSIFLKGIAHINSIQAIFCYRVVQKRGCWGYIGKSIDVAFNAPSPYHFICSSWCYWFLCLSSNTFSPLLFPTPYSTSVNVVLSILGDCKRGRS